MNKFLILHPKDNVMVALSNCKRGEIVNNIKLLDDVYQAHKIALSDIKEGENIIKYGVPIGHAVKDIKIGNHVHNHNISTNLSDKLEYNYNPEFEVVSSKLSNKTIEVYLRKNNDIGIRNEIWIIPTVGCINARALKIVEEFKKQYQHDKVDDIVAFTHPYGCSQMGDDQLNTITSLQNLAIHPNAGGVLVLGLGCENNQIKNFKSGLPNFDQERIKFLVAQDVEDEISEGIKILKNLYDIASKDIRTKQPISKLKVGLKCGGSDGFSGITANPLLGQFSDYLIEHGGTSVLTEVPEMFGAETFLMKRAINKDIFDKIVFLINDFKDYYQKNDQVIYENPSPGNKEGGISTLEDKSLGCTQKSGNSPVIDVLKTGQRLKNPGLNLLSGPGNDLIAATSLGLCGCHLVLFSTGRGTPFGSFIPTIKISTNTQIANKKPKWIDFNAGSLLEGKNMEQLLIEFIDYICKIASGQKSNNELESFKEIAIFKSGVTL